MPNRLDTYTEVMARKSSVTRQVILEASIEEFAAHGFAGSRVDSIAEAAGVNKRMIYVYYGDKQGLFSSALQQVIATMVREVPIDERDLSVYAGELFDYLVAHPEALRLSLWRHLENPDAGPEVRDIYVQKVGAMQDLESRSTNHGGIPATDLLVLVQGMASAWLLSPKDLLGAIAGRPMSSENLAAHRQALVAAVRLMTSKETEAATSA